MEVDPIRVGELLVGLGDVEAGVRLRTHFRGRAPRPDCNACGERLGSDNERQVELVDLPARVGCTVPDEQPHSETRSLREEPGYPGGPCGVLICASSVAAMLPSRFRSGGHQSGALLPGHHQCLVSPTANAMQL